MEHTLYLECYSGISGDMTVGALLDLGADRSVLDQVLKSLPLSGFTVKISQVKKAGLSACDFDVILQQENHDHDMNYLHNHVNPVMHETAIQVHTQEHSDKQTVQTYSHPHTLTQDSTPGHSHLHEHIPRHAHTHITQSEHTQEHRHTHEHATQLTHTHEHRRLSDIYAIIRKADMTETARKTAEKIFTILGEAEAKAHGTSLEEVHFHEAGAADSIVDIISAAVCLDNLNITKVVIPTLYEGSGTIRCQHGILPIPVPATASIIQKHHIPLCLTGVQGEFVTPTGAAIAAAIRTSGQLPEHFEIIRTGIGAGKRTYERPSILRAMLIQPAVADQLPHAQIHEDVIYKLETNIDDCSGEVMGYTFECLLNAGARDVHYFPVYMKKNRPAYQLNVLCCEEDIPKMEQIIFSQTTTIGIRRQRMERTVLPREITSIQTEYGNVQVKICRSNGHLFIYPEYESVIRICRQTGLSYSEIYRKLQEICGKQLS